MKTRAIVTCMASCCAAVISVSCSSPPPLAPGISKIAMSGLPQSDQSTSTGIYRDVNAYRSRFGKPAIQRHEGLDRLARSHSEYLRALRAKTRILTVDHTGFRQRAGYAQTKYGLGTVHENVAASPRGTSILKVWAGSAKHEPAMRGNWTYTGVGVAVDSDGMVFATQLFSTPGTPQIVLPGGYSLW